MNRISYKVWAGVLVAVAFSLFAACAPVAAPAPQVVKETVVVPQTVVVPPTGAAASVPRVALIMSGKRADQSWNQYMSDDVSQLEKDGKIQVSYAEDVTPADFERVAGDYASQNYDLIIAHTADFTEAALKVAKQYPNVKFAITGGTQFLPNVAGLNTWNHMSAAAAGYLAALLSKTKTVGIVGAFAYPTQFVAHEGFKFGVFRANQEALKADKTAKQVHCLETFTNTWFDTALGYEAAKAQMDQGADYIYISASGAGFGVIKAAEETKKAYVIGSFVDMNPFAPDVIVTSDVRHALLPLEAVLADIQAGKFEGKDYSFDLTNGGTSLAPYHNFDSQIPQDVKDKVRKFEQGIISRQILVPFVTAKLAGETKCEAPIPSS
ncbi:MAG TPA: BMP family protein [Anaerolineae bacterium]|nr:BMP family protein [Anaerolineae bacterium]